MTRIFAGASRSGDAAATRPFACPSKVNRRTFIGGSDARIIMGSDEAALVRLWREKRGEAEPEDLAGNLIVQLGTATEELNRSWYERNTGRRVRDVQRRVRHSAIAWMVATLDGVVEGTEAVFESKFMLPWSFSEEAAAEKYMPQLQHNIWVTHLRTSVRPGAEPPGWRFLTNRWPERRPRRSRPARPRSLLRSSLPNWD
jgi:hypothetical protein